MFWKLVLRQALYRVWLTALLFAALTTVVALFVYLRTSAGYTNRSMELIMKYLGHNLVILGKDADALAFHCGIAGVRRLPEDTARQVAAARALPLRYMAPVVQGRVEEGDRTVILTGIMPVDRGDETGEKGHLVRALAPDAIILGADTARQFQARQGDTVTIMARPFRVSEVRLSLGRVEDSRAYVHLHVAQELLGAPGRIDGVLAFLCMERQSLDSVLGKLNAGMSRDFPGLRVIPRMDVLQGRYLARNTTSRYLYYLLALVLGVTVALIVVTGLQEVAERRHETGILLAMGAGYGRVLGLYVAKVLVLAGLASCVGFVLGSVLARELLASFLVTNTRTVAIVWSQLPGTVLLTCLVALAAETVPLFRLLHLNPNAILTEE
ncbi:MAG: hypothetical protein A3K19_11150 [Lentisphaerae bacterium RIFOXYB12_FULL_65_16]|nr:MAG: hypothetical protein A3K18_25690 [Lentisphaerae bacterium RIFOXYA12_64_32]OGV90790.1 MAG: hypothetical protein A3K19_11150 [Lentisphaerae bacterium RIFOXYB12_FULL_65_16]